MPTQSLQPILNHPKRPSRLPEQTNLQDCLHEPHAEVRDKIINALNSHPVDKTRRWATRLAGCSSRAVLFIDPALGKVKPWINRCRHRLCPFCAKSRSAHVAHQLHAVLTKMTRPRLIVLTVKSNENNLTEQLANLRTWFRKLRHTPAWKKAVTGGAYTLEITRNEETGAWHPHVHIIYDGEYLPVKLLQFLWHKITGGSSIVWISEVQDREGAARELAKYIGKPQRVATFPDRQLIEYAYAVNGSRMLQTFGNSYGLTVEDKDPGQADAPDTYHVNLSRLAFLAKRGAATPTRLLYFIAERWPLFAPYIYHQHPQLKPDPTPAEAQARLASVLHGHPPPKTRAQPTHDDQEMLDAKIFLAFTRYRQEDQQGYFAHYDFAEEL